jgi:hypothetical protein
MRDRSESTKYIRAQLENEGEVREGNAARAAIEGRAMREPWGGCGGSGAVREQREL